MKARVLIKFYDSKEKAVRNKGDIIEVTPARFNEIASKGRFVEAYADPEQAAQPPKK